MHFIREALYRKPLEPKRLVYFRGGTAIGMACLFLAFCGYLISQIHNDRPLIVSSSQEIETYIDSPDIELCVQNSTVTIVKCSAMYYNWTTVDIENCFSRFFRPGANDTPQKCYVFESNGTYRMANGVTYDSRDALRRLDFYWNIDDLYNLTYAAASIPTLALQLYDPHFSSWKYNTIGNSQVEQETIINIQLGATRSTSMLNYSTGIYYSPQKYRAIKPNDAAAVIGFTPNYIDIVTLPNFQHDWPLQPNPPAPIYNKSLYHGLFSVQLAQSTIDVKTEVKQHSLLASVALAGGCYGVLTTIYILLFGMTRLTPWGLVHHIPVFISKRKHHSIKYLEESPYMSQEEQGLTAHSNVVSSNNNSKNSGTQFTMMIPWFFRQPLNGQKTYTTKDQNDTFFKTVFTQSDKSIQDLESNNSKLTTELVEQPPQLVSQDSNAEMQLLNQPTTRVYYTPEKPYPLQTQISNTSSSSSFTTQDVYALLNQEKERTVKLEEKSNQLSNRVKELETILSEYFIDTAYIDTLRNRKKSFFVEGSTAASESENTAPKPTV